MESRMWLFRWVGNCGVMWLVQGTQASQPYKPAEALPERREK